LTSPVFGEMRDPIGHPHVRPDLAFDPFELVEVANRPPASSTRSVFAAQRFRSRNVSVSLPSLMTSCDVPSAMPQPSVL
jgi:hypothetical protein